MLNYTHTDNMHTEELCGIFISISYKVCFVLFCVCCSWSTECNFISPVHISWAILFWLGFVVLKGKLLIKKINPFLVFLLWL